MLLESFAPNLRARHHHPLTAPQRAAAAGAALMALTSTGDVLLLGAVLGFAAGELTVAAAGVLAGFVVVGRFGSSSLTALAGAQHVIGPAGVTGSTLLAAAAWCAASAVALASPGELVAAAAFGVAAADLVAGPAVQLDHGASLAVRVAASFVGVAVAWFVGGWIPPRLARVAAVAAGVLGVALVLAS